MSDVHLIKAELIEFLHGLMERYDLKTGQLVQILRLAISDLQRGHYDVVATDDR